MSRFLALLTLPLALAASAATLPQRINFQGRLLDPATNEPRNGSVNMQFRLYAAPSGGSALWTEPSSGWQAVSVNNGIFSVQLGTSVALSGDLFQNASAYLGVTVQGDSEMSPRQQLVMSAYSFTAGQLVSDGPIRVNSGASYSTFTATGDLQLLRLVGSTVSLSGSVTATSGTFTIGGANQYSLHTASGIYVASGTLRVEGSGGIDLRYGIVGSTAIFTSSVTARQFFGVGSSTTAVKFANESVTSSVVLQDDNELAIPLGANETWAIHGVFIASSTSATPDFKFAFTVPAGAVMTIAARGNNGTNTTVLHDMLRTSGSQSPPFPVGANIANPIFVSGTVINGATAGFLQLRWSQNTSNATAMWVTAGSYLTGTRVD